MKMRRTVCLCLALLLLVPMVLSGCGTQVGKNTAAYRDKFKTDRTPSGLVAQNNNFELLWDDVTQFAVLHDLVNDVWYGTAPYEYYKDETQRDNMYVNYKVYNPLRIGYVQATNGQSKVQWLDSLSDSVDYGGFSSERIEGGVRLTYNFPGVEISVSMEMRLTDTGLQVRIPLNRIKENDTHLAEIAIAPYLVSAAYGDGNYVMVPSGGGALIPAKALDGGEQQYWEPVYGDDATRSITVINTTLNQVHLPVFGSSANGKGMLGIIEDGAATARINVVTGDADMGYTAAYASFRIRGEDKVVLTSSEGHDAAHTVFSETVSGGKYLSVQYQPLQGDTTYVGMANTYRNYLIGKGYLKDRPTTTPALSVNFLGATQIAQSFFGIPYQADTATTTLQRTKEISEELKKLIGDKQMLLTLSGYGEGGLANTAIGGGFALSKQVGKKKDMTALLDFAKKNNTVVALDYNLVHFQGGSKGFGVKSSAAYSANHLEAEVYNYVLSTGVADKKGLSWYLLSREKLGAAMDALLTSADELGLNAVSVGTLSHMVYSDYRDARNTARAMMDTDVTAQLKKIGKDKKALITNRANAYAAVLSDYIIEAPIHSSKFALFSQEIPFYSMVFQGYKALTSTSINTAVNTRAAFLDAVATGATLQFTLCDTLHDEMLFEQDTAYISSRYADWKDAIAAMVQESADLYDKIGGQAIVSYEKKDGLSKTVFENGITVYVNYTDADMTTPIGTVSAQGYVYG